MISTSIDIRDAFFWQVYQIAKRDKNVIFITDDMDAHVIRRFKKDFPKQFINMGVSEQNMIDVAAGVASCGKKVFTYGISNFVTMRCFEQIKFSICSMNLPVVIIGAGAGFSFSFDGPTHHGISDIAVVRTLPEITILNPPDATCAQACAEISYKINLPVYVRIDKGIFPGLYKQKDDFNLGFKILKKIESVTLISSGFMTHKGMEIAKLLETTGINVGVIDIFKLKPLSRNFNQVLKKIKVILTLEENALTGGLGSMVAELVTDLNLNIKIKRLASEDAQFLKYGNREWFLKLNKLDNDNIIRQILKYDL